MQQSETDSSDMEELLTQVFVLQKMGYTKIALQKCTDSIARGEDNEEVVILAAELYIEGDDLNAAYDLLTLSALRYPDCLDIDVLIGEICSQLGHTGEAVERLSSVLGKAPDHKKAVIYLAKILADNGQFQSVCNTLDKYIAVDEHDQWIYIFSATILDYYGKPDLAASYLSRARKFFPQSLHFSYLMTAVGGGEVPDRAPAEYMRELFDQSANSYDEHLKSLGNAGPRLVSEAIEHLGLKGAGDYSILDAGCGTGLCGGLLKPYARWLEGVDISPKMLEQAQERGCYDSIQCSDIVEFTRLTEQKYDLVLLSDVLVYFGSLHEILANLSRCLIEGGHVVFSVETLEPQSGVDQGCRLAANGRYSHTPEYVLYVLGQSGFDQPGMIKHDIIRHEFGEPVNCLMVVARSSKISNI